MRIVFVVIWLSIWLGAAELEWLDYQEALQHSRTSNKPILLEVMSAYCTYCAKMDEEVFSDPTIQEKIYASFIPARIDMDKEELPDNIKARMTPTFFFIIGSEEKPYKKVIGAWNREDFEDFLNQALKEQ